MWKVEITINGVTRNYQSPSYDEIFNRDWDTRVRNHLESMRIYEQELTKVESV